MERQGKALTRRQFLALASQGLLAVATGCRLAPPPGSPTPVPATSPPPTSTLQPTPDLAALASRYLREVADRQEQGTDISPVIPHLKALRGVVRRGLPEQAGPLLDAGYHLLSSLPTRAGPWPAQARVEMNAAHLGGGVPPLAGNVVIQDPYPDPRFQRFVRDLRPNLLQMKLFLSELNPARDNYPFLEEPGTWEETFRQVNSAGGRVMLHLRNIPARLSQVPAANTEPFSGKGPLAGPAARAEWEAIVEQVVTHFNASPETRISYVQDIGEPNIGTNWLDPSDLDNPRPTNVAAYVEHFLATLRGARRADPQVLVGGPTLWFDINDTAWWDGFLGGLGEAGETPGFLSTHHYEANFGLWDLGVALAKEKMAQYGFADRQLLMTEWNLNLDDSLPQSVQRSHLRASHALMGFLRLMGSGLDHTYYYLGPGSQAESLKPGSQAALRSNLLILKDGQVIPNTSYNTFLLFARLHNQVQIPFQSDDDRVLGLATLRDDQVQVLMTYYEPLTRDLSSLESFPYLEPDWDRTRSVELVIQELPFEVYNIETYRIDREHANVGTLGPEGAELRRTSLDRGRGTPFRAQVELPLYGVVLVVLSRQSG